MLAKVGWGESMNYPTAELVPVPIPPLLLIVLLSVLYVVALVRVADARGPAMLPVALVVGVLSFAALAVATQFLYAFLDGNPTGRALIPGWPPILIPAVGCALAYRSVRKFAERSTDTTRTRAMWRAFGAFWLGVLLAAVLWGVNSARSVMPNMG